MTITLNGIIATSDYNEDFSSHDNWNEFVKAVKDKGCLIWGRKTYEMVGGWSKSYLETLEKFPKVIVSSNKNLELRPGFILANSPENALKTLEKMGVVEVIVAVAVAPVPPPPTITTFAVPVYNALPPAVTWAISPAMPKARRTMSASSISFTMRR